MDKGLRECRDRIMDKAVIKIEEIMMYRGCMPEEGQLREILEKAAMSKLRNSASSLFNILTKPVPVEMFTVPSRLSVIV